MATGSAVARVGSSSLPTARGRQDLLEAVSGRGPHDLGHHETARADREGLGRAAHAELERDLPVGVLEHRPVSTPLAKEVADVARLVAEHHAEDLPVAGGAMACVEVDELRMLLPARNAPAGHEVQHHPPAPQCAEAELSPSQRLAHD